MLITDLTIDEVHLQPLWKKACKIIKPTFGDCVGFEHGWVKLHISNAPLRNLMRLTLLAYSRCLSLTFVNVARSTDLSTHEGPEGKAPRLTPPASDNSLGRAEQ